MLWLIKTTMNSYENATSIHHPDLCILNYAKVNIKDNNLQWMYWVDTLQMLNTVGNTLTEWLVMNGSSNNI